ncbi:MAG: cyclopropane-fatty-acyl-phospholipid synthase [Phycisphaerae bacterium]|nr:MAG: cyclopropane-fatty-acyl-phospholipid synthase [Phycisphaerae bacterium]
MNNEYQSKGPIAWAERGWLPDVLVRWGIRRLLKTRLEQELGDDCEDRHERQQRFLAAMQDSPVAIVPQKANEQHYEIPARFYELVLGKHRKYSGCFWPTGTRTLDDAEAAMLKLTCKRAELADGQDILELGCGWGSLTLWMAEHFPNSTITAVSNSTSQGAFIREQCRARGLSNVTVITADMNVFSPEGKFDRVVSVEMFEHMRNLGLLLERIASWLRDDGKLFVHIFTHTTCTYPFETTGRDDWMGTYFFSGGMMPSDHLLLYMQDSVRLDRHWCVNGQHYERTANAWLANMTDRKSEVFDVLQATYGPDEARRWYHRWRIFFMACAELWGYRNGNEWHVGHYLMSPRRSRAGEANRQTSSLSNQGDLSCASA